MSYKIPELEACAWPRLDDPGRFMIWCSCGWESPPGTVAQISEMSGRTSTLTAYR
jgi:hypothetical protein